MTTLTAAEEMAENIFNAVRSYVDKRLDRVAVHPDTVRTMVRDALDEAVPRIVALIPAPKDGEPGRSVDPAEVANEVARQLEALAPYLKGEPGAPGLSPDDFDIELRDDRTLIVRLTNGGRVIQRAVDLPIPVYRGLFKSGEKGHRKGDVKTFAGSSFIALRDTDDPIGGDLPSQDWQLMVKRGRDANG